MGAVLRDRQGIDHTVFDRESFLKVLREVAGDEIFDYFKQEFEEEMDLQTQLEDLEAEKQGMKDYYENKLKKIEEYTSGLAEIIRQKNIDRKKISEMAGKVSQEVHRRWFG